ncbi:uncharacterized protein LOC105696135 [Orussus abietinus]|uniref:uncharacterized protein LOC105696135 n=1 Tax=Orussus abietinus TaxID=222816 RepID=UPI000626EAC2|nr:uncharacterized protein LOC105696135 [Orussus abietinus]
MDNERGHLLTENHYLEDPWLHDTVDSLYRRRIHLSKDFEDVLFSRQTVDTGTTWLRQDLATKQLWRSSVLKLDAAVPPKVFLSCGFPLGHWVNTGTSGYGKSPQQ